MRISKSWPIFILSMGIGGAAWAEFPQTAPSSSPSLVPIQVVRPTQRTAPAPVQTFRPAPTPTPVFRPVPVATPRPSFTPAPRPTPRPTPKPTAGEEAVDLSTLTTTPTAATLSQQSQPHSQQASSSQRVQSAHALADSSGKILNLAPTFKFYFDLWLINQPNVMDFTFKNVHSYTFVDLMPDNKLSFSFSFNLASRSNYFELAYQATPKLQVRGGKIMIPFGYLSPHSLYGGRPNLSVFFMEGQTAFLPDLWAEPGVAAKYRMADMPEFRLDGTIYVTNGFQANTSDPISPGSIYPDFNGLTTIDVSDNNRDKAIGGRLDSLWFRKWGLSGSFYTCRWSNQGSPAERLLALGLDSQLRFASTGTEFQAGLISMNVNLPGDSFTRGGWYTEAAQKLGAKREWTALFRAGYRQNDNRVIEVSDQRLVGGAIVWRPGLVQWSFETWRDLKDVPGKVNYTLTALRAAVEL